MQRINVIGLLLLFVSYVSGQSSFYDATAQILGQQKVKSTVAIAIDDINGDQKDDLVLFDEGKHLKTFTQTSTNQPFVYKYHTQTSAFGEWAAICGDLNNDGSPEIIASGNENGSEILFSNNGAYATVQATPSVYSQNTNLVDLNNDSFLDLFVCNDTGENQTYLNDGEGKMVKTSIIDFQTSEEDDMSGNYSSIFTDIDNDGDLDLYIGKCRAGVTDPTDRRRVNTLYVNNGDGTYSEDAENFGLANGSQTWSIDAGDVDNDGDIDILVANHDREHDLLLNDGEGYFTRFGGLPSESKSFAYQSFFGDFDNNGWLDIFITEPSNSYILYNNEMKFSQYDMSQNGKGAFSGATGDFNSDGYLDLYIGFAFSFQSVGNNYDVVLLNEGKENNFIKIHLEGSESNKDAVGARVVIYHDGLQQTREVIAGRSYGIMNSTVSHFGIGLSESIDSIIVRWPSGNKTSILDPISANTDITIAEDGCISANIELPDLILCDDQVIVKLGESFDEYLWSDGSTQDSLVISEAGSYSVEVERENCKVRSNSFSVFEEINHPSDEIISVESYQGCKDKSIKLESVPGSEYLWSNGVTSKCIYVDEPGMYQVTVTSNCNTLVSDLVSIDFYNSDMPQITEDTVSIGVAATLMLEGESVHWYKEYYDQISIGSGACYFTVPLVSDTVFYAGNTVLYSGTEVDLLNPVPLNSSFDDQFVGNDTLDFKVLSPFKLNSISVRTQVGGSRTIEIWNDGNLIKSVTNDLSTGKNEIFLDEFLEIGTYQITTNELMNIEQLGSSNPKFSYSEQFIGNDKIVEGYLKIGESVKSSDVIPYFFDWKIIYGELSCEDRYPVRAIVKDGVSTSNIRVDINVYPNPSNGSFIIQSEVATTAEIWNAGGKQVLENLGLREGSNTININLNSGVYVLKLITDSSTQSKLLIIN